MTIRHTFTMLAEQRERLRRLLLRDEFEYGALLLCGRSKQIDPWTGEIEERAVVQQVIEVPAEAFLERTQTSMTWSTTPLFNLAKSAMRRDLAIRIAHSHPGGGLYFSKFDNEADRESFEIVFGRMDTDRPHFAMVMDDAAEILVRAYGPDLKPHPVEMTRIVGDRLAVRYPGRGTGLSLAAFDRQTRVFGARATEDLTQLRVGIVGCGGTGGDQLTSENPSCSKCGSNGKALQDGFQRRDSAAMMPSAAATRSAATTSGLGPRGYSTLPGLATKAAAQPARSAPKTSQPWAATIRRSPVVTPSSRAT